MSATFTKGERLSSFKEIQALMKKGNTFFHYPFKVVWLQTDKAETDPQEPQKQNAIIVSVPKRNFKRAVKRNLLKRKIREAYRLNKELLVPQEGKVAHVLFVYVSKEIMEFSQIEKKVKDILTAVTNGKTKETRNNEQGQS